MGNMFSGLFGGLVWATIGPWIAVLLALATLTAGGELLLIKSYRFEINNLQMEVEQYRNAFKGAEDAAFSINNQYEVLKEYLNKLGRNVVNTDGEIDEKEFENLLKAIEGKKK